MLLKMTQLKRSKQNIPERKHQLQNNGYSVNILKLLHDRKHIR